MFSNTIQNLRIPDQELAAEGVSGPVRGLALDYLSKMKIAVMVRRLHVGRLWQRIRVAQVGRAHRIRGVRGVQNLLDVDRHG